MLTMKHGISHIRGKNTTMFQDHLIVNGHDGRCHNHKCRYTQLDLSWMCFMKTIILQMGEGTFFRVTPYHRKKTPPILTRHLYHHTPLVKCILKHLYVYPLCIGVKDGRFNSQQLAILHFWSLTEEVQDATTYNGQHCSTGSRGCSHTLVPHLEWCGPISSGIVLIHHPVDDVLKALKERFEYPVKLHGITTQPKFATHVMWSVLPSPGFSPAIVLVDKHGEEGNDVFSLIVRNLSIDECLFNKGTIVQRIDLPNSTILYKILVSVLNRPFLHKQFSKSCHYFLLVCDSKSENLSGHFFVSS